MTFDPLSKLRYSIGGGAVLLLAAVKEWFGWQ